MNFILSSGCSRKWQQRQYVNHRHANLCRKRLALGPASAGCHTATCRQRVWEFVVEEKKQESVRALPCAHCWKDISTLTWRRNCSLEWGAQCSDRGQVNVCASFGMINYKRVTASKGRSMSHLTWDAVTVTQHALPRPPILPDAKRGSLLTPLRSTSLSSGQSGAAKCLAKCWRRVVNFPTDHTSSSSSSSFILSIQHLTNHSMSSSATYGHSPSHAFVIQKLFMFLSCYDNTSHHKLWQLNAESVNSDQHTIVVPCAQVWWLCLLICQV